ncbi:MAG: GPW/gp25 family protein [Oscillibacter sp.]|nr:GPW/gp25 family protein [Oscillibacter sp.]
MNGREFLGRGVKFPLQVNPRSGKIAMSEGEEDIREAIRIILHTIRGERIMRPDFGSNVMDYVFAPASSSTRESLSAHVREVLSQQEPRITDVKVQCTEIGGMLGGIAVEVSYLVRTTNNRYNHVYPFYFTEGSEGGAAE